MTDQDSSYRPRSPDLTTFESPFPPPAPPAAAPAAAAYPPPPPLTSPLAHRASYDASPFFTPQYQHASPQHPARAAQQYIPPFAQVNYDPDMARRSSRLARQGDVAPPMVPNPVPVPFSDAMPNAMPNIMPEPPRYMDPAPPVLEEPEPLPPSQPGAIIEVKTKFPVARIKRIMQADEDVGKVAQVTPIAVSKALELFMISLVTKAAKEAKDRNSKRVNASHLKQAVAKDEVLDFLADIIAKIPDQPTSRKHDDDGSDGNEPKRKRGGRRPKEDSD